MDSLRIVVTNPDSKKVRFVLWLTIPTSWIRESGFTSPILKNLNRGFVLGPELPKIWPVFTNPTNPHKSWPILGTIARNKSLRIQAGRLANPDSQKSDLLDWNSFQNNYWRKNSIVSFQFHAWKIGDKLKLFFFKRSVVVIFDHRCLWPLSKQ